MYKYLITVLNYFRYSRHDKRSKLPGWILSHLRDAHLNLSTDMALHIAREVVFTELMALCFILINHILLKLLMIV